MAEMWLTRKVLPGERVFVLKTTCEKNAESLEGTPVTLKPPCASPSSVTSVDGVAPMLTLIATLNGLS